MKKIRILGVVIFIAAALCACGEKQKLVSMRTTDNGRYVSIIWEDREYVPFCAVSKRDCGAQIGYRDGDLNSRVCEYKDYPSTEWIANYLTVDGGAMLFKEKSVTDIPDGLQSEYKWN